MNLGTDQLSDDQLMELLQEILGELANRDPIVRQATQNLIITESEKLDVVKASIADAIEEAKTKYLGQIRQEVKESLVRDLEDPVVRLCKPGEEAAVVLDATLEARLELIDLAISEMQGGVAGHLKFEVVGNHVKLQRGGRMAEIRSRLDPQDLRELGHLMYQICNK